MLIQEFCKARIRSFLMTGMIQMISLPTKPQTCSIMSRSGDWDGHGYVLLLQPCDSSTRRVGRSIVMLKHEWIIFVAKFFFVQNPEGFLTMFRHNFPHSRFHQIRLPAPSEPMAPTALHKRFYFYWPCADNRVYISPQLFPIPSNSHPRIKYYGRKLIPWLFRERVNYQIRICSSN